MTKNLNEELGQGRKFVIAANYLVDKSGIKLVILSDFKYWTDHYSELELWAENNHAQVVGSTIEFHQERDLLNFILRWS